MFQAYVGVVEDRFDPMELGRCRVRVFGVHTDDRNDLPTGDLPWSMSIGPIQSASNSGVGLSPTGIVHGSWVIGFFLDGEEKQQFMMMGTLTGQQAQAMIASGTVAGASSTASTTTTSASSTASPTNQTPVTNTVSGTVDPTTVRQPSGWTLGQTSKQYESGSRGCGAINNYHNSGDLGGASYGSYQFASYLPATMPNGKGRPNASKSPVIKYLANSSYGSRFAGMQPATAQFDQTWQACASSDPTGFQADQHAYVKATYYDVMIGNLKRAGLDLTPFGAGVQDLVWSTAVQMGPARTSVILTPLKGMTKLDDVTIINAVMDYKIANVPTLFSRSSSAIQAGVRSRYVSEKKALLALASQYNSAAQIASTQAEKDAVLPPKPVTPIPANPLIPNAVAQEFSSNAPVYTPYTPTSDPANKALIAGTRQGFSDPDGVYPTDDYVGEPDTNKLARGVYAGTPSEDKSLNRATGIPLPNGDTFDQPLNPYNGKYPYNKVFQSEAGHVVEYDDTPGAERINIYHTAGTFTEIDANGNMTRRVVGSDYQITDGNGYVRVEGRCNISVGGSANVYVSADANIEVDGDVSVSAGNDIDVYAAGRVTVSGGEALDFRGKDVFISADNDFHVTAGGVFNVEAGGAMNLKAETGMYVQAANAMNIIGGSGVNVQSQSGDIDVNANGNANIQSGGDSNVLAGGSAKVYGTSSAHLRSAGVTALDGSSMQIQNGSSVQASGAGTAQPASDAEYGEAGLDDTRTEYDEYLIDDVFPTNRVDGVALKVETPEEAANGGTAAIQAQMVTDGMATPSELNATPVAQSAPDTTPLSTSAKPFTIGKTDAQQMAYIKTLTNIPANFKLTPNFTLGALSINAPAQHDRIAAQYNLTEGEIAANLYALAVNVLEPIKAKYPNMFVTSAFRAQAHNTLSKSISQHCLGLAADMQFTGVAKSDYYALAAELKSLLPAYDQLLLEYKTTGSGNPWIHISFNTAGNRGQVLTMFNNKVHSSGLTKLA
jgi:uncharacterized protein YcbK (DUF882 family)